MKSTQLNNFKPTAPPIINDKNNKRFQFASSLKKNIPIKTAPAAPNPVHTCFDNKIKAKQNHHRRSSPLLKIF